MKTLLERGQATLAPVLGRYFTDLAVTHGKGAYLYDTAGRAYLDFGSGIAVTATGHCHPTVVKAIRQQAGQLLHACIGVAFYEPPIQLAETLNEMMGGGYQTFFCQSGSEAIEASLKLARYASKKAGLLAFKGGFHGRTLGALSLTTSKEKYRHGYAPLLPDTDVTFPFPACYRCPWGAKNDPRQCTHQCIDAFEIFLKARASTTAAVLLEPILGEGGYYPLPAKFATALGRLCREQKVLLILDEIQTGLGRTGHWFCFEHYGLQPDIVAVAKGLASGLPLGACIARQEIMQQWTAGAHGSTFGSNPLTCAAGVASLQVLKKCLPRQATLGKKALSYLQKNLGQHPLVGDMRGLGLMIAVEFVTDKTTKAPATAQMKSIMQACRQAGLLVLSCGLEDNVIRILPPLTITTTELLKGLQIFTEVVNAHH